MPVVKSGVTQREATLKARERLAGYGRSGPGNWPDEGPGSRPFVMICAGCRHGTSGVKHRVALTFSPGPRWQVGAYSLPADNRRSRARARSPESRRPRRRAGNRVRGQAIARGRRLSSTPTSPIQSRRPRLLNDGSDRPREAPFPRIAGPAAVARSARHVMKGGLQRMRIGLSVGLGRVASRGVVGRWQ